MWLMAYRVRKRSQLAGPQWDGHPYPGGGTILVKHEYGYGDSIMVVRYAETLAKMGFLVHWHAPELLASLYRRVPSITAVYGHVDAPIRVRVNASVWAMDLPVLLHAQAENVGGAKVPYLSAPWWFPSGKFGICWHGGSMTRWAMERSLTPAQASSMIARTDAQWVSLVPGESLLAAPAAIPVGADFLATARIVSRLRAVVTVDTAIAHLAGALGVRTHLLLPYHIDYRWLGSWYPTLTKHQQTVEGDWSGPIQSVLDALQEE